MTFTKLFTVAAVATTLTASAFAIETHGGSGEAGTSTVSTSHDEMKEHVNNALDVAKLHSDNMVLSTSAAEGVQKALNMAKLGSDAIATYVDKTPACKSTNLNEIKGCLSHIKNDIIGSNSKLKGVFRNAIKGGCSGNIFINTCKNTAVKNACGYLACDFDKSLVKNCMQKNDKKKRTVDQICKEDFS